MTTMSNLLISINPTPHKTYMSGYGPWAVGYTTTSPGYKKRMNALFWSEKDALKWIKEQTIGTPPTEE